MTAGLDATGCAQKLCGLPRAFILA